MTSPVDYIVSFALWEFRRWQLYFSLATAVVDRYLNLELTTWQHMFSYRLPESNPSDCLCGLLTAFGLRPTVYDAEMGERKMQYWKINKIVPKGDWGLLLTLTLTSDDLESHIIVNISSTLTNTTIWFVAALSLIMDVRTYRRTDGRR